MPGAVQMDGAEGIIRRILNRHSGQLLAKLPFQLFQCLSAPNQALFAARLQRDFLSYSQHIALLRQSCINGLQNLPIGGCKVLGGGDGLGSGNQVPQHSAHLQNSFFFHSKWGFSHCQVVIYLI